MGFVGKMLTCFCAGSRVDDCTRIRNGLPTSTFFMPSPSSRSRSVASRTATWSSLFPFDVVDIIPAKLAANEFIQNHHVLPRMFLSSFWDPSSSLTVADGTSSVATISSTVSEALSPMFQSQSQPELSVELETQSLSALGHDLLIFLAASVVVEPLGKILGVTPVLLYLILGFVAGPYGLSIFASGTEVNSEIGDGGILFLLFIEGLNLSPERLKALGSFFSLGAAQLLLSVCLIFFGLFFGGPYLLPIAQDVRVPLDADVISLLEKPVIAFSIAAAGALSSSAFVLPILKEKGWEKGPDGIAALSILLLQDLAVAPLLIILPLIAQADLSAAVEAGAGAAITPATQDPVSLSVLIAKATVGFGLVLAVASFVLRRIFQIVAKFGSSQTFIAASLLVVSGMGVIADDLGLSATTGAFAAGVLLAESGYRAQIEADIKPFEGILLGVFFVTAGASLDSQTVIAEWPTLIAGICTFIAVKFGVVLAAGELALGLNRAQALRVAFLLAGGGEFAFVVFKLANQLGVLPEDLSKLLTASVVISMSLTPLLGELASWASDLVVKEESATKSGENASALNMEDLPVSFDDFELNISDEAGLRRVFESFDEDGSGCIDAVELRQVLKQPGTTDSILSEEQVQAVLERFDEDGDGTLQFDEFAALWTQRQLSRRQKLKSETDKESLTNAVVVCGFGEVSRLLCSQIDVPYVAFSQEPSRIAAGAQNGAMVVYGDGASPSLVRSAGVESPLAIVITYNTEERCMEATIRLHEAFPEAPIYVRTSRLNNVKDFVDAGATRVVVETEKVAASLKRLVGLEGPVREQIAAAIESTAEEIKLDERELTELAYTCELTPDELAQLYSLFSTSPTLNKKGEVQLAELRDELLRRRSSPLDDEELKHWMGYDEFLSKWVTEDEETMWVTFPEFVRFAAGKL